MSHVAKLGIAVATPFDPRAKGAKLTTDSPAQTFSASHKVVFDGVAGNDGYAYVSFNPSPWRDVNSIFYTNSSSLPFATLAQYCDLRNFVRNFSDGIAAGAYQAYPGMNFAAFTGLPFLQNDGFNQDVFPSSSGTVVVSNSGPPNVRARIVSAGLKITFTGSTLSDSGVYYSFVDPFHENLCAVHSQDYDLGFTSHKFQRIASRGVIELNLMPVTRDQQELSTALDTCDIVPTSVFGEGATQLTNATNRPVLCFSPVARIQSYFRWNPDAGAANTATASGAAGYVYNSNIVSDINAYVNILFPLSRRNCVVVNTPELLADGSAVRTHSITWTADGIITWTVNPPTNQYAGACYLAMFPNITSGGLVIEYAIINYDGTNWYLNDVFGKRADVLQGTAQVVQLICFQAIIPEFARIVMKGLNPGTPFHVEAVIHVEYSGIGVQGRTVPTIPDQMAVAVCQQAVTTAREIASNHEHASVAHAFGHAVMETAARHAPDVAESLAMSVMPEAAPIVGPLVGAIANVARKRMRF